MESQNLARVVKTTHPKKWDELTKEDFDQHRIFQVVILIVNFAEENPPLGEIPALLGVKDVENVMN